MWKKTFLKILLAGLVLFIGYIVFVSTFHFSEGTRTGYLSKFAHKGYIFKTYEGDLYMGGANADNSTLINNTWSFSVKSGDDQLIHDLQEHEGKVVKLFYFQVLKNMPWQGDTEYFVYKVEFVREN